MIEWYARPLYQRCCVEPLIRQLKHWPLLAPMHLTMLAIVSGLISAISLWSDHALLACVFLWMSGYFDTLDGSLARFTQSHSPKGAVLDIVGDRIVEGVIMLGLFSVNPTARGLPVIIMLIATLLCITSFLVVGIFTQNNSEKSFHYSRGLMERPEAFLLYSMMMILPKYFLLFADVYIFLVFTTAVLHVNKFLRDADFSNLSKV